MATFITQKLSSMKNKSLTDRRTFVKGASTLALGTMLLPGCKEHHAADVADVAKEVISTKGGLDKFGIQLWTIKDVLPADPLGTIKELAGYGFNQLEGFEGDQGIFWGQTPKEFKSYLNGLGLEMVSSHCNINENFEQKAADAAEAGLEYLICPWIGPQKSVDAWKEVTDKFNKCGEICKANGIKFGYHNHAYSFIPFSGMIPQDYMMDNTDPDLVEHEMDIYWVVTAGVDPIEYLDKYPNRFKLCHIKDRMKDAGDERLASCNLGTGIIDYPTILSKAKERGMKYFLMEQERYDNTTPMECAQVGANYLKKIVLA